MMGIEALAGWSGLPDERPGKIDFYMYIHTVNFSPARPDLRGEAMQVMPRIPPLSGTSFEDARNWFIALRDADLIFDPRDDLATIHYIASGERVFTDAEAEDLRGILDRLFDALGDDVDEACYPIFSAACGFPCPDGE